jgi:hypothetical protein
VQAVTVIMSVTVGLTFLFSFGNVLNLALNIADPVSRCPGSKPTAPIYSLRLSIHDTCPIRIVEEVTHAHINQRNTGSRCL